MKISRTVLIGGLLGALGACATDGIRAVPGDASAVTPVDAPILFVETERTGPQLNDLGGEIPKTAPTASVGEGPIGDASPG